MAYSNIQIVSRIFMSVTYIVVFHHIWEKHAAIKSFFFNMMTWVQKQHPWSKCPKTTFEEHMDKVRSRHFTHLIRIWKHIDCLCLVVLLCIGEMSFDVLKKSFPSMNAMLLVLYTMTHIIDRQPSQMTVFSIDVFVGITYLVIIARNAFLTDDSVFFMVGPALALFRAAAGMLYMDIPKTFAWNLILSFTRCWKFYSNASVLQEEHAVYSRSIFIGVEMITLASIMLTCLLTRELFRQILQAQLKAEDDHQSSSIISHQSSISNDHQSSIINDHQ